MFTNLASMLTHISLSATMPFYCCWLVDVEDTAKPCAPSVIVGSMMFSARLAQFAADDQVWLN